MTRLIQVGTQTQGRTSDSFFDYRHIRSWEGGVEDEWLERNPGGWLQHRSNVGSPPNHLYSANPQDVDALAYEWGREEGRKDKAIRDDGRSVLMRTRQVVKGNEDNIEAVFANWGYRASGLWSDDEHRAVSWKFAHIWTHAARGWLEEVPDGTFWIPALSPNGYIADGLGPSGSFRPELSIWAAFGEPDIRALLELITTAAGAPTRIGTALHTYGEIIRPGHPAWADPAIRVLCPPELQREGGSYGGNRIEHALACMRQYGLLSLLPVMVGEFNRQLEQDVSLAEYPVPPDWPGYLALVKRWAPGCPFTASQATYNDRELCRWEWEATIRCVVSRYPEAKWGPWLYFGHLFEDDRFKVLQIGDIRPMLALKQVEVPDAVEPPPDDGGGETMPDFVLGDALKRKVAALRAGGHAVVVLENEQDIVPGKMVKAACLIDGEANILLYFPGDDNAVVLADAFPKA